MKFSDIEALMFDYKFAAYSPSRMHVIFGCECGCGGNSYTAESWTEEEDNAIKAIERVKLFCDRYGIEYDGVE